MSVNVAFLDFEGRCYSSSRSSHSQLNPPFVPLFPNHLAHQSRHQLVSYPSRLHRSAINSTINEHRLTHFGQEICLRRELKRRSAGGQRLRRLLARKGEAIGLSANHRKVLQRPRGRRREPCLVLPRNGRVGGQCLQCRKLRYLLGRLRMRRCGGIQNAAGRP